jgi:acetylornithine deacetylase/succinyl-diaminopimelate desuccinylase-like protein
MRRLLAAALLVCPLVGACAREKTGPVRSLEWDDLKRSPEEWMRLEPVRILRDYVRIDTTAARGEAEGAGYLRRFFECEGIEVEIVCPSPGRCNVLARLPGRHREGALLLLNHIDVVEALPEYWKDAAPFEGKIKNGFLYGRGVFDMKSLGVAQALAMARLKRRGIVPETDILFLGEADEEIGQRWGTRWLLAHRPEWFAGVRQVLNEGGMTEMIVREIVFWGLETLQAGYGILEFEAASEAPLESLASRWPKASGPAVEPHPHVVIGFDLLANRMASPLTDPLRHLDRVIRHPEELAILPDRFGSFLEPRMSWSSIYRHPAHMDRVRRFVTVSVPPGSSPEPYLRPIRETARREGLTILTDVVSEATLASPYPTPFTELLRRVTEARWPGVLFGPLPTFGGYTTSILLRDRGIPTYGYQPIAMNVYDAARRHGNDERVFLRDYLNGVDLLSEVVEEFATAAPASN